MGTEEAEDRSAALLRRWQDLRDREALDELLRAEVRILKARVQSRGGEMTSPDMGVSDVAQEAVARMLRVEPPPKFETAEALRAYLWLAAWRLLVGRIRRPGREAAALDPSPSANIDGALATTGGMSGPEKRDQGVALQLAMGLLDPGEQEILDLVYLRDLGIDGAARELGLSHEAAKMRVHRARKSLRAKLEGWAELIG